MPETVRFGIIGAGLMGREFALAAARWPSLTDLDVAPAIVAVCDTDPRVFDWYRRNFPSVEFTSTDYHDVLADDRVDAVYCAVPHNLHADLYCDIIGAGKHLLGEKPFGIDRGANLRILSTLERHGGVFARVSSEFPFYPGAQRVVQAVRDNIFGQIIEVRSGFLHSSDLDPTKSINWKRMVAMNGEYGCMGDLGMHAVHLPLRFGWYPRAVHGILSNIVRQRPGPDGTLVPCETWDNAILVTDVETHDQRFPMTIETKRIAPGEMNTWYIEIVGMNASMRYSTKQPKTLWTMQYHPGDEQQWRATDLGHASAYRTVTGPIFEFGFSDAIVQMWAAFVDEMVHGDAMSQPFGCATPQEAEWSHRLFTAALESERTHAVVAV
ncbi:MAG: hypothetical protein NVS2B16_03240 [Chloroflexota bacterium]